MPLRLRLPRNRRGLNRGLKMDGKITEGKDTGAGAISPQIPFRNVCKRMFGDDPNTRKAIFFSNIKEFSSENKSEHFLIAHALPIGEFVHPWWGDFALTFESLSKMAAAAERWRAKGGLINLNFNHDDAQNAGEIIKLEMRENGLWVTAKLTPNGYKKMKSDGYKRFSAEWAPNFKDEFGEKYGDMFFGGALTNIPYFSVSLDGLYLLEDEGLLKVASRATQPLLTKETKRMDPEILTALTGEENPEKQKKTIEAWKADSEALVKMTADAKNKPAEEEDSKKTAALTEKDKKIASLQTDLNKTSKEVAKMQREKLIAEAYRAGKLTFVQKEAYAKEAEKKNENEPEKIFAKPFQTNEDLKIFLATAPKVIPDPLGTETDIEDETSEADLQKASAAGIDPESVKEDRKIKAYMAEHKMTDYGAAQIAVAKEKKANG